jgi:predicted nucleotidyltransferase
MNEVTKFLKGSDARDLFKQRHKRLLPSLFAIDIDFCLISRDPWPHIVAVLDYKKSDDEITFAEVVAYNDLVMRGIPVYIVVGDADVGKFSISKYTGGHHVRPDIRTELVCKTNNWREFESWEIQLRHESKARFEPEFSFK